VLTDNYTLDFDKFYVCILKEKAGNVVKTIFGHWIYSSFILFQQHSPKCFSDAQVNHTDLASCFHWMYPFVILTTYKC